MGIKDNAHGALPDGSATRDEPITAADLADLEPIDDGPVGGYEPKEKHGQ